MGLAASLAARLTAPKSPHLPSRWFAGSNACRLFRARSLPKLEGLVGRRGRLQESNRWPPGRRNPPPPRHNEPGLSDAPPRPIDLLEQTIRERAEAGDGESSYTARLLTRGVEKIGSKVTEEAAELVEAASEPGDAGREHFVYEAGDLLYHTLVLMRWRGVELAEVEQELARRFGVSGLTEKTNRANKANRGGETTGDE